MELKDEYVVLLNNLLRKLDGGKPVPDSDLVEYLKIDAKTYAEIKNICLEYGTVRISDGYGDGLQCTTKTRSYLDAGFFRSECEKQKENAQRQKDIDIERSLNIKNAKRAYPLALLGIIISFLALIIGIIAIF